METVYWEVDQSVKGQEHEKEKGKYVYTYLQQKAEKITNIHDFMRKLSASQFNPTEEKITSTSFISRVKIKELEVLTFRMPSSKVSLAPSSASNASCFLSFAGRLVWSRYDSSVAVCIFSLIHACHSARSRRKRASLCASSRRSRRAWAAALHFSRLKKRICLITVKMKESSSLGANKGFTLDGGFRHFAEQYSLSTVTFQKNFSSASKSFTDFNNYQQYTWSLSLSLSLFIVLLPFFFPQKINKNQKKNGPHA